MFQSVPLTAEQAKTAVVAINTSAAGSLFAALAGYLPLIVAIIPALWYTIQIWETKTVQKHVRLWRVQRRRKRAAKIAAKLLATVPSVPAAAQIVAAQAAVLDTAVKVAPTSEASHVDEPHA